MNATTKMDTSVLNKFQDRQEPYRTHVQVSQCCVYLLRQRVLSDRGSRGRDD